MTGVMKTQVLYNRRAVDYNEGKAMDDGYQPGPCDVICGRGKRAIHHPGNARFRLAILLHLDVYQEARTKIDKSLVVINIADSFKSVNGAFIKENAKKKGQWVQLCDRLTREKIGHALRDTIMSRVAEGRNSEDIKQFAEVTTLDDLMNMSPSDLENVERQLRLGGPITRPFHVKSSGSGAITMTALMKLSCSDLEKTETKLRSGGPTIPSCLVDSKEDTSMSTRNNDITTVHHEAVKRMRPLSRSDRQLSDQFAPIRLDDMDSIDMSVLHAFSSNYWLGEPAGKDQMRRDSDFNGEVSAFVMDLLEGYEEGFECESRRAAHFKALLSGCVE